jgi:hypothetical protein
MTSKVVAARIHQANLHMPIHQRMKLFKPRPVTGKPGYKMKRPDELKRDPGVNPQEETQDAPQEQPGIQEEADLPEGFAKNYAVGGE